MLKDLNEKQLKAVKNYEGPYAVVAGAGTGKTRTLTYRIAHMINEGIHPSSILAMTFTNKAAREMKERVVELTKEEFLDIHISTFHSFSATFLRNEIHHLNMAFTRRFLIIDEEDSKQIIRDTVKDLNYDNNKFNSNKLKGLFSKYKNKQINNLRDEEYIIFNKYNEYLEINNALDFDDLIIFTIKILKENKSVREYYNKVYTHILIDEFQDTNVVQYELMKLLVGKNNNIFIVGDPDQSIYSFRGANYDNYNLFLVEYNPEVITLDENYRSKTNILDVANKLISKGLDRPEKNLTSNLGEGYIPIYETRETDRDEAYFVTKAIEIFKDSNYSLNDIAVLYRANSLSRVFEESLLKAKLPYIIYGGTSFFDRKEIKDTLAYIRLAINNNDNISFKRIVNTPRRKLGPTTINKLEAFASLHKISMFDALDEINLPKNALTALNNFKEIINNIKENIEKTNNLVDVVDIVGSLSGYYEMLEEEGNESKDRLENIYELKTIFYESSLEHFSNKLELLEEILNDISLKTDLDMSYSGERVTLATVHQVKGLEFKVVFVVALEEEIFPNVSAFTTKEIDEERRILYVALTRAKERLIVSRSKMRYRFGVIQYYTPSRFLEEAGLTQEKVVNPEIKEVEIKEKQEYSLGSRICHETYGMGVIVAIDDDKITVAFAHNFGIKILKKDHPAIIKVN